jgi:hypothetical protein
MTVNEQRRRLGVAQVEALFGSILIATATASATSAGLISLGYVALRTGLASVLYLHVLGVCNLALRHFYPRSRPVGDRWRAWAIAFTAINCAVGVGFGWAPVGLTTGGVEAKLVVALSHLARRGSLAAFCRLAKPLNLLNLSLAVGQVVSSKTG